jgi:hypothetical protein
MALAFATVFVLATSMALSQWQQSVTASVPFSFTAGKFSMPAGKYIVRLNNPSGAITIQNKAASKAAFVLVNRIDPKDIGNASPRMVFNRYRSHYFLSKIYAAGGMGCALRKGTLEKEIALRAAHTEAETVNLALENR